MMEMMLDHVGPPSRQVLQGAVSQRVPDCQGAHGPERVAEREAAHLGAAEALLHKHGMSLADCRVLRECAEFDAADGAVLYVVHVGQDVDTYALNEALTAVQLARGLVPSAQLDVVFQP